MLMIKINSTGSKANSYNLIYDNETLIMEFGLTYKETLLTIENTDNIVGGILTHKHRK